MTVGLLFPGEMGAELGAAARAEVLWASEGRSAATARRAARAGLEDVVTIAALAQRSETILSVCPPAIAEGVATEVAALGFRGLYVDANAVAPARMTRIQETLSGAGARVVDGAVLGSKGLHLYLAGDASDVAQVARLFAETRVDAIALPGGIGAASALKMAFGGWNKIGIALAAQAHAIARAYGVEAALAAEGVDAERLAKAAARAWRWGPEMDEVADSCAELGLPDGIARGAADLYRRWERHRDDEVELARLLADLSDIGETVGLDVVANATAALADEHRRRIAAVLPEASLFVSGSASVNGLPANDLDLVALVADVSDAAARLRTVYPPHHEDEWRIDWAAFRDPGPPQVDVVVTQPGTRGDAHHRRAWELLAKDPELIAQYRALKAIPGHYELRKAAFFERVVGLLEDQS